MIPHADRHSAAAASSTPTSVGLRIPPRRVPGRARTTHHLAADSLTTRLLCERSRLIAERRSDHGRSRTLLPQQVHEDETFFLERGRLVAEREGYPERWDDPLARPPSPSASGPRIASKDFCHRFRKCIMPGSRARSPGGKSARLSRTKQACEPQVRLGTCGPSRCALACVPRAHRGLRAVGLAVYGGQPGGGGVGRCRSRCAASRWPSCA